MKEFRKNEQGLFVCEECHTLHKGKNSLTRHVQKIHMRIKTYYDKWVKENNEDICKIRGKETQFSNSSRGYKHTCSYKCNNLYTFKNPEVSFAKRF